MVAGKFILCIVCARAIGLTSCFVYRRVWSRTCWQTPSKGRYRSPRIHSPSAARAAHEERDNTVDSLAADYVQLACLCLDEGGRRAISPRLMETVRFFLFLYVWVIRMTSCFVNSWRGEPLDGRIRT